MLRYEDKPWSELNSDLVAQWEGLILADGLNISLHPHWTDAIATATNRLDGLRLFTAWEGDSLRAVIPYFLSRFRVLRIPLRTVELAGNLVSYHQEIIASGYQTEILSALLSKKVANKWQLFRADNVLADTDSAAAIRALVPEIGSTLITMPGERSPYFSTEGDWDSFLAGKSKSFRYALKRKENKLRKAGDLDIEWYSKGGDASALLDDILTVESESWKKDSDMAISEKDFEREYYKLLLPFLMERDWMYANVLKLDGQPIAYNLCYSVNGKIGQLKTSFDNAFRSLSPGIVMYKETIKRAFELGASEFDFLGDAMPHKLEWTDTVREHHGYYLFSKDLGAHIVGKIKDLLQKNRTDRQATN